MPRKLDVKIENRLRDGNGKIHRKAAWRKARSDSRGRRPIRQPGRRGGARPIRRDREPVWRRRAACWNSLAPSKKSCLKNQGRGSPICPNALYFPLFVMIHVAPNATAGIRSELVSYPGRSGRSISGYIDHPPVASVPPRFVVMSPKYGETKKNNLQMAYYLAANGFTVLRFDFTCHFGESEGDMLEFTLPEAVRDTIASLDYLEKRFDTRSTTLIASSLSALASFGVAAVDRRINHLMCVVGVVDLVYTLVKVYQEDLIGGFIGGRRYGILDILGHEVDMDHFFSATIAEGMHTLDGTIEAVKRVECPVSLLPAEGDVWVKMEDVESLARCNPLVKIYPIEGAMHEVRENRVAAEAATRQIVAICRQRSFEEPFEAEQVLEPDKKMLIRQNKVERERLRRAHPVNESEDEFWGKYLGKYRVMEKMGDYQNYLDLVGGQLGAFKDGEILLDAGCGNGLFGVWVLRELMQRNKRTFQTPPLYIGLDLTDSGLCDAMEKHGAAGRMLEGENGAPAKAAPGLLYARTDLDVFGSDDAPVTELLRFQDNTFDKIACSLLLSYLRSPGRLLKTLHQLLCPGGKIVISSMKPFCDLSAVYRDFVEEKADQSDIHSARELLRAAGAIKIKQEQGYYAFFSEEELIALLRSAGFKQARCFTSLGNQANVAIAVK